MSPPLLIIRCDYRVGVTVSSQRSFPWCGRAYLVDKTGALKSDIFHVELQSCKWKWPELQCDEISLDSYSLHMRHAENVRDWGKLFKIKYCWRAQRGKIWSLFYDSQKVNSNEKFTAACVVIRPNAPLSISICDSREDLSPPVCFPLSRCQNNPFPCPAPLLCSLWSVRLWCIFYLKAASAMGN